MQTWGIINYNRTTASLQPPSIYVPNVFSPRSIAGLALWFDASDSSSITIATGVSQWNDKSGNNNNATQSTGSAQPTVHTAGQNGLNTITFSAASSQRLLLASTASMTSGYTALAVYKKTIAISAFGNTGDSERLILYFSGSITTAVLSSILLISTSQSSTAFNQVSASTSAGAIFFNGTNINNTTDTDVYTPVVDAIGFAGSGYNDGEIAELVLYNHATHVVTTAERLAVEAYLKAKWATP